jgi:hypothetical protein
MHGQRNIIIVWLLYWGTSISASRMAWRVTTHTLYVFSLLLTRSNVADLQVLATIAVQNTLGIIKILIWNFYWSRHIGFRVMPLSSDWGKHWHGHDKAPVAWDLFIRSEAIKPCAHCPLNLCNNYWLLRLHYARQCPMCEVHARYKINSRNTVPLYQK